MRGGYLSRRDAGKRTRFPERCRRAAAGILLACALTLLAFPARCMPEAALARLEEAVAEARIPGMAVVICDRDEILYEGYFGVCFSGDRPFVLGSLSKSFTAVCVMRLAERGEIDLDAPLTTYLPDARASVTIRELLNHTGGLGTYQTLENYEVAEPRGRHVYANVNYALLGKVVEAVSGMSYAEYLRRFVLEPLRMSDSGAETDEARSRELIPGYRNWFGFPVPSDPFFPAGDADWIQAPAGYVSAGALDMARYLQMYLNRGEGILKPESVEAMFSETIHVDGDIPYEYGMGWTVVSEGIPAPVARHSGLVETFMTCMYILPEQGLGIALLADMNDYLVGTDLMDRIGWNLVLELEGAEPGAIEPGEYWRSHLAYDGLFALCVAAGVVPLCAVGRFRRSLRRGRALGKATALTVAYHFGLAAFLLLLPPLILKTPLWVIRAFVPDLYAAYWVAVALLVLGGAIRLVLIERERRRREGPGEASLAQKEG